MTTTHEEECPNFPEEIWLSILTNRNFSDHHIDSLSLVSKHFLTLTNHHLKHSLHILPSYPTPQTLPTLLTRFTNLHSIDASRCTFSVQNLNSLLHLISLSKSPVQELDISNQKQLPVDGLVRIGSVKEIRVLKCSKIGTLRGGDLVKVVEAMRGIRDLDISYPENGCEEFGVVGSGRANLNDDSIVEMLMRLNDLVRINVSGNHFISDRGIVALGKNCRKLREIVAVDCSFVTASGISKVIRECCELDSVMVGRMDWGYLESEMIKGSGRLFLSGLHFKFSSISDEFLFSLVEAGLPLKKLSISVCPGFSLVGISSLVSAYKGLTYLEFQSMGCLTDEAMSGLTEFLPSLVSINLNWCRNVGNLTLISILKCCRHAQQISMENTGLGKGGDITGDIFVVNRSIQSLKVAMNKISDEFAIRIALACPNLEVVDLSQCWEITAAGITRIVNSCTEIRHLCLNKLSIDELIEFDTCKIEILEMNWLRGMDDNQLDMLGRGCPNLLSVDLFDCVHLSADAVIRLVRKCPRLRQIKMDWFEEMSFQDLVHMVTHMVFYGKSLRKIVFSNDINSDRLVSPRLKEVMLQHGCQIVQR